MRNQNRYAAIFVVTAALLSLPLANSSSAENMATGGWRSITGLNGVALLPQDLSVQEARHMLEHHLAAEYGGRLRLGIVRELNEDIIVAELVTPESYLVQRLEIDRHTGWFRPLQVEQQGADEQSGGPD
jgi:hypothetical protein